MPQGDLQPLRQTYFKSCHCLVMMVWESGEYHLRTYLRK